MIFWQVTTAILDNWVTTLIGLLTFATVIILGWRRGFWHFRMMAFVMLAWVTFELVALFDADLLIQIAMSRYARTLNYFVMIFIAWAAWKDTR